MTMCLFKRLQIQELFPKVNTISERLYMTVVRQLNDSSLIFDKDGELKIARHFCYRYYFSFDILKYIKHVIAIN